MTFIVRQRDDCVRRAELAAVRGLHRHAVVVAEDLRDDVAHTDVEALGHLLEHLDVAVRENGQRRLHEDQVVVPAIQRQLVEITGVRLGDAEIQEESDSQFVFARQLPRGEHALEFVGRRAIRLSVSLRLLRVLLHFGVDVAVQQEQLGDLFLRKPLVASAQREVEQVRLARLDAVLLDDVREWIDELMRQPRRAEIDRLVGPDTAGVHAAADAVGPRLEDDRVEQSADRVRGRDAGRTGADDENVCFFHGGAAYQRTELFR